MRPPDGTRVDEAPQHGWGETWDAVQQRAHLDRARCAASRSRTETGKTPAQVALNWLLHRPGVTAPIIGARTMDQLEGQPGRGRLVADPGADGTAHRRQATSRDPIRYDALGPSDRDR